ncbi:kinase-like protein [Sanghuangporus baumii]|uniref:Kinase-like protein n=1 Tax=Sanghuangporus baumii TaxID=108892 RepID=A0A9Q5I332_SANBA|nr:kinase-like protein [Sanghuangporus baumii]
MPAHLDASFSQKADTGLKGSGVEILHRTLAGLEDFDLTGRVAYHTDSSYLAGGAYGDIRIGDCAILGRGRVRVAVKCIRLYLRDNPEVIKLIEREVRLWSKLNHPNILPLLGYTVEQHGLPALISEFMDSGTILKYVQAHPVSDIMHMVLGLVEGVSYLHKLKIIHSDIKSDNVLVSQIGEPLICDFGISRLIAASHTMAGHGLQGQSSTIRGSARWMSPELLLPSGEHAVHSKESDIWAFGMTVYVTKIISLPESPPIPPGIAPGADEAGGDEQDATEGDALSVEAQRAETTLSGTTLRGQTSSGRAATTLAGDADGSQAGPEERERNAHGYPADRKVQPS